MAGCDDADVRPDHHIVGNVESAEVIESTILIYEYIAADADIDAAGRIEWRYQKEAVVDLLADEIAEQGPDFVSVVEGQTVESRGNRHRPLDVRQHGRRFRRSPG